ncbi:biotin synthase-related radical SAM superfamily protein [Chryseomicrobium aureum]|uniref:anti-sigma-F factor Fin n=1 Tax=Chryseomicrobium aureum TaxID=1441723 RepID=UPI00195EA989|nr:anti-sigma-F factor Fin [Chryseomicrobium aureum]MBM7707279.1 biotin synthase-related radical SAM superfamily protein [Chryseomicrobium aureum]
MIRSRCKYCRQETSAIPYESFTEIVERVSTKEVQWHPLMTEERPGRWFVDRVCLDCRDAMERNPLYFSLNKWIQ